MNKIDTMKAQLQRERDHREAVEKQWLRAKADLEVAHEALAKIKAWPYLNPPEYHTCVPAFDFTWLRDVVAAGLFGAGKKE